MYKAKQSKTKQNRAEQSRAEQRKKWTGSNESNWTELIEPNEMFLLENLFEIEMQFGFNQKAEQTEEGGGEETREENHVEIVNFNQTMSEMGSGEMTNKHLYMAYEYICIYIFIVM